MVIGKELIMVSLCLPVAAAIVSFISRSYGMRNLVVWLTGIALVVTSIAIYVVGPFEVKLGMAEARSWESFISVAGYALLALILYIGIINRHVLIIIMALLQAVLLFYLSFGMGISGGFDLGSAFVVDTLAIVMALVINIVGSLICIYGVKYIAEHEEHAPPLKCRQHRFMFWLIIFLAAMNGLVFADNLLLMFFFWEVTTFCSFQLIRHDLTEEAIRNACRALWINCLGGVAFALAIVVLAAQGGEKYLSIQYLINSGTGAGIAGIVLLAVGLLVLAGMTKSALLPFQSWLLGAMVAPTPVSALLHSSTMVKAGVYLILRLAPVYAGTYLSDFVAAAGAFTFLITTILAISQSNGKRVLAYSTIANLGLIVACAGINTPAAISAAIILIIFHAVSKGLLFLCTGFIEHQINSRDIEDMGGLADRLPLTTAIFTVGVLSMFLPPFGMLVGKWAALESATHLSLTAFMLVMAMAVTALFWIKWLCRMLEGQPGYFRTGTEPMAIHYKVSLMGLAAGAVLLGMFIIPLIQSLVMPGVLHFYGDPGLNVAGQSITIGQSGVFTVWPWFALLALILVSARILYKPGKTNSSPIYMSGENVDASGYATTGDRRTEITLSNYYFENFLNEGKWTNAVNSLAILAIILMLGVTML